VPLPLEKVPCFAFFVDPVGVFDLWEQVGFQIDVERGSFFGLRVEDEDFNGIEDLQEFDFVVELV